jgi:hypothetical protein
MQAPASSSYPPMRGPSPPVVENLEALTCPERPPSLRFRGQSHTLLDKETILRVSQVCKKERSNKSRRAPYHSVRSRERPVVRCPSSQALLAATRITEGGLGSLYFTTPAIRLVIRQCAERCVSFLLCILVVCCARRTRGVDPTPQRVSVALMEPHVLETVAHFRTPLSVSLSGYGWSSDPYAR